jgi:hypothetical protein
MANEYPTLNEVAPSWADIKITLPIYQGNSVEPTDIASIKWSDKVTPGVVRGVSGGRKKARTVGDYECDCSITFYRNGWEQFREALGSVNVALSLAGFDVLIQHTPPGSTAVLKTKIVGCRIVGRTADMAEGSDADKIEVPIDCMRIEEGPKGLSLL